MLSLLSSSCSENQTINEDLVGSYNRKQLLSNLSGAYIVPAYSAFNQSVISLDAANTVFIGTPSENNLNGLKEAWTNCFLAWQDVAFLEFGPAADITLRTQTNVYPVDTVLINKNITEGGYNISAANNLSAKGIQALDFLLFSRENAAEAVIYLSQSEVSNYTSELIKDLKVNTEYVVHKWNEYSLSFIANSESNADGTSMSTIVNTITNHYEAYIRRGKVGIPSGAFNGFSQQAMPEHVEAFYSGKSTEGATRSIESFEKFFKGISFVNNTDGEGLDDYLDFTESKKDGELLSSVIESQFSAIKSSLSSLNYPLSIEVVSNNTAVAACYEEMQKMVSLLKVNLTSSLGILVNYQDSDGD